jgi:hypothetical protein
MAFVAAMNDLKTGVNGATVYTEDGVGDHRVSLFTMLNRGLSKEYIEKEIESIFQSKIDEKEAIQDMCVMAFQTRDIRGGKGEKQLFYDFIETLYNHSDEMAVIVEAIIKYIPEYGCWRDMWHIAANISGLRSTVLAHTKKVFDEDMGHYTAGEYSKISLLAKWLPREKSVTYKGLVYDMASALITDRKGKQAQLTEYRKRVAQLNKAIKTVEINMCGGTWASIVPENIPGRCMKIHTKAFFNEPVKTANKLWLKKQGLHATRRYPDDEDREECRRHFEEFTAAIAAGTKKAKGANVIMPHELVAQILAHKQSNDEQIITQSQWESIRNLVMSGGGLGKAVPMCDFSGSMSGLPKLISFALGILISEINHSAFRDHILTFDASPKWHSFSGQSTLKDKVKSIKHDLGQGLNTDFYKACMMILNKMVDARVPIGEEPEDLIVLTDMGWDQASTATGWETQLETIRRKFKEEGEKIWGTGWKMPRIVIWNLSAKFNDFHAKADEEGVVMLSGWSPAVLKALQKGGIECQTPYQALRELLDDERYNKIREELKNLFL